MYGRDLHTLKLLPEEVRGGGCQRTEADEKMRFSNLFPLEWIVASGDLIRRAINQSIPQAPPFCWWVICQWPLGETGEPSSLPESRWGWENQGLCAKCFGLLATRYVLKSQVCECYTPERIIIRFLKSLYCYRELIILYSQSTLTLVTAVMCRLIVY